MKFGAYLEEYKISEWKEFYLDYRALKKLLKPLQKLYKLQLKTIARKKRSNVDLDLNDVKLLEQLKEPLLEDGQTVLEICDLGIMENGITEAKSHSHHQTVSNEKVVEIQLQFQELLIREFKKIEFFLEQNMMYYLNRLRKITLQFDHIKLNKQFLPYGESLEDALKVLYKEIYLMKDFVELNYKAKTKIIKKYHKVTKYLPQSLLLDVEENLSLLIESSETLKNPAKKLSDLISECEQNFYLHCFEKYKNTTIKVLKDYATPTTFTQSQAFYLGFFVGILMVFLMLCVVIAKNFNINMDTDVEFKSIFPMFRAFIIICMYIWILGLNVWAWDISHIDYKLCFHFSSHYSDVLAIFKRAALFSSILVSMILCYLIIRTETPFLSQVISFIPVEMTPLVCWLSLIIYLFFPLKTYCNYPGRVYLWRLFYESITSIYLNVEFRHTWFFNQLTSMIGPMRDIEYTMCYYAYYNYPFDTRQQLCTKTRGIVLLIGVFPHSIRVLQCIRIILNTKKFYPEIINAGKYSLAIIVSITSFLTLTYPVLHSFWWILVIFSVIYSSFWDMKFDFAFLQPGVNYPLREKLAYKNKYFYYLSMIMDLVLTFVWLVSVSPEVVLQFMNPEFLALTIYSLEVIRRGMWNLIRVEVQHLHMCEEFKVTYDVELPFKKVNGKFVLKNANLIDLVRMNKRLNRIRKQSDQLLLRVELPMDPVTPKPSPSESACKECQRPLEYDQNYVTTTYRNSFAKYINEYQKMKHE